VYCGISGFGATGPDAGRPLHAPAAHAMSGIMTMVGEEGDPPFAPAGRLADPLTGIQAALAISAALAGRERTGKGSRIDLAVMDSLVWLLGPLAEQINMPRQEWQHRPGHLPTATVPGGTFRGRDGWMVIGGGIDEEHWKRLANALGRPDLAEHLHPWRREHQDEVYKVIGDWLMEQPSVAEAERYLQARDIIASKVNTTREMVELPFLHDRGTIEKIAHRDFGEQYVTNSPFHFDGRNPHWVGPAPRVGEHNAEVFSGLLGMGADEIASLEAEGVLFKAP
jgi:crotonobetainyl-CoA:carnitine CoA-transferase CaiB-like acyl-CoA transferase